MSIEDMKVGQAMVDSEDWGDPNDPNSNWSLIKKIATFAHTKYCEFVVYIGDDQCIDELRALGISDYFIRDCVNAKDDGFNYVCFYG